VAVAAGTFGCGADDSRRPLECASDVVVATPSQVQSTPTDIIAFVSDRDGNAEIYSVQPDGSNLTRLTQSATHELLPTWSPDGTRIAFLALNELRLESNGSLMVMNADGTQLAEVMSVDSGTPFTWSPDGHEIAYAGSDGDIHVIDLADGRDKNLTNSEGFDGWPAWSPDGDRIVFTSDRGGSTQLWVMRADGTAPALLTAGHGEEASWSPTGDRIAFASTRDGDPGAADAREWNEEIYVMDAQSAEVRRVTTLPGNDHWPPTWSPEGNSIAFTSDGCGDNSEIYTMRADGSALANVTNNPARDAFPAWRPTPP
jgi:TolB protein